MQITNPFLPNYEYLPDPEPRIYNGRVYIYGSHDKFNGISFCLNDYIAYSAPVDDLSNWRYEGVIFRKKQDPNRPKGPKNSLFAPDVIQGNDGKYYMYYFIGFEGTIGVAVCDEPAGSFQFLSYVKHPNGDILGTRKTDHCQFDPGIFIDDNKKIYLYSGFAPKKSFRYMLKNKNIATEGAMVMELEEDMYTMKSGYDFITKTMYNEKGTDYEGHGFFEASSMRKINGKYYFIYSSYHNHELCYAYSDFPNKEFKFGGILVSIADLGLSDIPLNHIGNTHGSILELNDNYYIFYHRQTNQNSFSRQTCAEKIEYDGLLFKQAETTSQGLNGQPLKGVGKYQASIACHLYSTKGVEFYGFRKNHSKYHAYFTQHGKDRQNNANQYIKNITKYTTIGYKYFNFNSPKSISFIVKGNAKGFIKVYIENDVLLCEIRINKSKVKTKFNSLISKEIEGVHTLIVKFEGTGKFDFYSFEFEE